MYFFWTETSLFVTICNGNKSAKVQNTVYNKPPQNSVACLKKHAFIDRVIAGHLGPADLG